MKAQSRSNIRPIHIISIITIKYNLSIESERNHSVKVSSTKIVWIWNLFNMWLELFRVSKFLQILSQIFVPFLFNVVSFRFSKSFKSYSSPKTDPNWTYQINRINSILMRQFCSLMQIPLVSKFSNLSFTCVQASLKKSTEQCSKNHKS